MKPTIDSTYSRLNDLGVSKTTSSKTHVTNVVTYKIIVCEPAEVITFFGEPKLQFY